MRYRLRTLLVVLSASFIALAMYCFLTAWSYVGTAAAADHPYVPAHCQAGVLLLGIGGLIFVVRLFLPTLESSHLLRFTIRDVLWLTAVVGLGVGWFADHRRVELR